MKQSFANRRDENEQIKKELDEIFTKENIEKLNSLFNQVSDNFEEERKTAFHKELQDEAAKTIDKKGTKIAPFGVISLLFTTCPKEIKEEGANQSSNLCVETCINSRGIDEMVASIRDQSPELYNQLMKAFLFSAI